MKTIESGKCAILALTDHRMLLRISQVGVLIPGSPACSPPARPPRPSTPTGTINIIDKIQTMIYGNN